MTDDNGRDWVVAKCELTREPSWLQFHHHGLLAGSVICDQERQDPR